MSDNYQVNQFGEVARYVSGRDTNERRDMTPFEEQLQSEVEDLEAKNERLEDVKMYMSEFIYKKGLKDEYLKWKEEN